MKEDDQGDILTQIFDDSRYELVVKFFCGLNQFKSCPVMTKSKTKWDIYWNYCTIGDQELKLLSRCLKDFPQTLGKIVLINFLL